MLRFLSLGMVVVSNFGIGLRFLEKQVFGICF